MIGKFFISAFFAVFAQAQVADVSPMPGSIAAYLNITSLNNILQLAAPLAADQVLSGHTFEINYKKRGIAGVYNVDIKDISFVSVDGFDVKDISVKEGTETLVATVGGINVNATCNAKVSGLWVVKAALEAFTVKNITMKLELSTTSDDQVHWQLQEVTKISIEDLTLTLDSNFWQILVDKNMNLIKIGIYTGLQKLIEKIDAAAAAFNLKLASQDEQTFITNVKENLPLNMTMTSTPLISHEMGLIIINMDGRFVDTTTNTTRAVGPSHYAQLVDGKQREEIFIHQSVLSSLVLDRTRVFNNTNLTNEALIAFPQLKTYYGDNVDIKMELSFKNQTAGNFDQITINTKTGIQWGDISQGGIVTTMKIMASNATTPEEVAIEFQTGISMNVNFTFDNFVLFKSFSNQKVVNTVVTDTKVMFGMHEDFDKTMTDFIVALGDNFNAKHADGTDFKKNTTVGFVAGLLKHSLLTPFVSEEYLYGGFSWITDGVW